MACWGRQTLTTDGNREMGLRCALVPVLDKVVRVVVRVTSPFGATRPGAGILGVGERVCSNCKETQSTGVDRFDGWTYRKRRILRNKESKNH